MNDTRELMSPKYREAMRTALWTQIPIAILCFLMLDGGVSARYCGTALLGFWLGAAFVAARRPWNPTYVDLWYWRWSFIPCFVLVGVLASLLF
jgi:hypothetical protein